MLPEQRKRRLLELVSENGGADVGYLATLLDVSPATIRRDLHRLEGHGHLRRTHGGAVLPHVSTAFEPHHREKSGQNLEHKRAIARTAAKTVSSGEVVVLDSGSTTLALAHELKRKRDLTVITSDLTIAMELCDTPGFNVIVLGGKVRPSLYSVVGPTVEQTLTGLNANHSFLGADAVSLKAGLTNASLEEVPVKRLMMFCGQRTVLLADNTKFGKVSLAKVTDLTDFDEIITDEGLDAKIGEQYVDAGVHLTTASEECNE
ncbi:MAG: DeoR/GlpR family DNA-binding transcription regulator [Trueperaceae bacterium]